MAKTTHRGFYKDQDLYRQQLKLIWDTQIHLADHWGKLITVEVQELSLAVPQAAETENPKVHDSPEHTDVVLLKSFEIDSNQFKQFPVTT